MIDTCFICSRSSYDFEHHGRVRLDFHTQHYAGDTPSTTNQTDNFTLGEIHPPIVSRPVKKIATSVTFVDTMRRRGVTLFQKVGGTNFRRRRGGGPGVGSG